MLKAIVLSAALVGAGLIGAAAQSTPTPAPEMSATTHCKEANGQARMKTAGNTSGAPSAPSSAGQTGGAAERPAGGAPPATGSSGAATTGSAANLPAC